MREPKDKLHKIAYGLLTTECVCHQATPAGSGIDGGRGQNGG